MRQPKLSGKRIGGALATAAAPQPSSVLSLGDTWQPWAILPGLEIHLHAAASEEVRALARRVVQGIGDV